MSRSVFALGVGTLLVAVAFLVTHELLACGREADAAQIRLGMSRAQVEAILGGPPLNPRTSMLRASLVAAGALLTLGATTGGGPSGPAEQLRAALRKAAAVRAYAFRADSLAGGAGGSVEG